MRVIDSSAWIEWLLDSPTGQQLSDQIPKPRDCIVPTIVQLELSKWLLREKDEDVLDNFIAYTMLCNVTPLDTAIARRAAEISAQHKLATADAIIYATALHLDADILTCDAHFKGLENVIYYLKMGG
ncbi:type II toxin-antitoxin system VapC family toxin [Rhizobium sp. P40RR-XXII]|uniref:type II toxin-antitoxin system VapC family toxin n=1 Tax=unclassified Rhizobium TaxID=2613769 RepID=UPI001456680E|nr:MULTISPECIES: type II toxin-antitoxin system VapC family toxin [unclassified Rhizobium]NLR83186.1 type II toxin-antitoxin system VapC family toxin [Rhizobium sp. P28RR-XV]NLS15606.1 type II toxin-antitoxin system VapC family toxin [Rhizobium sp. P40RR-XXII]